MSSGVTMQATILAYMFTMVEMGRISVPLGPGATSAADNVLYIQEFVANLLRQAFPHLTDNQIKITVQGLFNLDHDINAFKEHLRDFLVQIRVQSIVYLIHL
jgi:exportin-1